MVAVTCRDMPECPVGLGTRPRVAEMIRREMMKRLMLAVLASLFLLVMAPSAHAQSATPVAGLSCTFFDNGTVTCTATNFQSGSTVTFTIASTPTLLGTAVADSTGTATLSA